MTLVIPLSFPFFGTSEAVYYAIPVLWIIGAALTWVDIRSPIPKDDKQRRQEGWVLTKWTGQEAKFRLKTGLALSVGNVFSSLLAAFVMLTSLETTSWSFTSDYFSGLFPYAPSTSTFSFWLPLWPLRFIYAVCLIVFAAMSGLSLWNLRREIQITHTRWSKPRQHDAIKYAKQGKVLIGHEFERTIQSAAIKHKQEGIVEEEVAARPTARLVGFTRPFFLDLVNAVSSHLYCLGGTGFGKTWFGKALIVRVWNALRIPSLLLDWKGEYSPLIARMGGLVLKVPESFTINPLKLDGKSPVAQEKPNFPLELTDLPSSWSQHLEDSSFSEGTASMLGNGLTGAIRDSSTGSARLSCISVTSSQAAIPRERRF